ncbi:MFS transporter [Pseudonocardia nematodicida]|uniref:MFS transporter n=1 Tax=Pseudonocardia nematodicida TaxID=1206997 RepID=A0ABV1KBE8_9PSEU
MSGTTGIAGTTDRRSLRKVIAGSFVGTSIEWYDFFLYGSAAALVFNQVFFPTFDPLTGTLLAFATYSVAFIARPLGGVIFGVLGDRYGRKSILITTLMLMGCATFLMGLLPGYETIGIAAPLILVFLRFCQGLGLGGEWGGAVALVAEHGEAAGGAHRRGFYASWPQVGVPAGNLLAVVALAVCSAVLSDEAFTSWGWRLPFLFSAVLILVSLWIRATVEESPLFTSSERETTRTPVRDIFRSHRKPLLVTIGIRIASDVSYYTFALFSITYVTQQLELPRSIVLNGVIVASIVQLFAIPYFGALSDRVGRRPVYLVGALGVGAWGFAFFPLVDTGSPLAAIVAVTVGLFFQAIMFGPMAAYIAELFPTAIRYTGTSMGYQLAGIVGGSVAPLIGVSLLAICGTGQAVAVYTAAAALVTVAALWWSHETRTAGLTDDATGARPVGS